MVILHIGCASNKQLTTSLLRTTAPDENANRQLISVALWVADKIPYLGIEQSNIFTSIHLLLFVNKWKMLSIWYLIPLPDLLLWKRLSDWRDCKKYILKIIWKLIKKNYVFTRIQINIKWRIIIICCLVDSGSDQHCSHWIKFCFKWIFDVSDNIRIFLAIFEQIAFLDRTIRNIFQIIFEKFWWIQRFIKSLLDICIIYFKKSNRGLRLFTAFALDLLRSDLQLAAPLLFNCVITLKICWSNEFCVELDGSCSHVVW